MQKLKVGDTVQVMKGNERASEAKRGKLLNFDGERARGHVEGVRLVKRHVRKGVDSKNQEGGIIEKTGSIALANLALVCPKCDKPTRVGIRSVDDKKKRFCKKCDALVD